MRAVILHKSGERVVTHRIATANWLRVGRNANCEVHLPDPRVALEQGMIVEREGPVYIEGELGSQNITRKAVRSVRLKPGTPVDVGPYRITAQTPPPAFDVAISVELVKPLAHASGFAERAARRTLDSVGLSKRGVAWGLLVLVLMLFLLLPAGRVLDLPWSEAAATLPLGDRFWNPGPLTLAHQPVQDQCASCHEKAFQTVRNAACLECHGKVGAHVAPASHAAGLFSGEKCTACHAEHKGIRATHRDGDGACVDCHREVRARAPASASRGVADFAREHPPFRVTLAAEDGQLVRVRQGQGTMKEPTGLKFPHPVHLDPRGVKSPGRGRVELGCGSCHVADTTRRTFQPVVMARHCQECHRLVFEPAVTTREVPHGDVAAAATVVEEFYASLALKGAPDSFQKAFGVPGQGLLRRAGEPSAEQRRGALAMAGRKAEAVTREMVEVRTCGTCHEVKRSGRLWEVASVAPHHAWMPQARFDHKSHAQAECTDCHAVTKSDDARDVAMPTIERCRDCHAGARAEVGKVMSSCLLCHGFHDPAHPREARRAASE